MAYQLLQPFSICILSWLLFHILYVFVFPCLCGYNLMPSSSLEWQNGQQPLLASEMWVPWLQPYICDDSFFLHYSNCCRVRQTTQWSRGRYSYYEAFHTDLQQYGNGQYLCGKTWEAPCSLEPETAAVACASSISRACAQVALSWGHHHRHLLRWWYFPVFLQKLAQCKKAHHPC